VTSAGSAKQTAGDAFARAHAELLADRDIQFALPSAPQPRLPHWLEVLIELLKHSWPAIRIAIWVGLAVLAVMLIWMIGVQLFGWQWFGRSAAIEEAPTTADWRPDAAPTRLLLAEADRLAADGRYAEAARLVLRRSVEDIEQWRPGMVRPATTSRDLAAAGWMPAAARPAFMAISEVVEKSLFADRGATADAWTRARGAYAAFALARHWQ